MKFLIVRKDETTEVIDRQTVAEAMDYMIEIEGIGIGLAADPSAQDALVGELKAAVQRHGLDPDGIQIRPHVIENPYKSAQFDPMFG